MFQDGPSQGGAFKAAGTSNSFNHQHASQMAHGAAKRLATAKALGGGKPPAPGPAPAQSGPAQPVPQGRPNADWRAGVSAIAAHGAGASVGPNEIHQGVAKLVQAGHLTPFQGQALVQHHGPLTGPAGHRTMHMVAHAAIGGPVPPAAPAAPAAPPMPQAPGGGMMVPPRPPAPPGVVA
jgi:hypothetical protein